MVFKLDQAHSLWRERELGGQIEFKTKGISTSVHQISLDSPPGVYIIELCIEGEKQQFRLVVG